MANNIPIYMSLKVDKKTYHLLWTYALTQTTQYKSILLK